MTSSLPPPQSPPRLYRADSVAGSLGVYLPATAAARVVGLLRGIVLAWVMVEQREFGLFQITLLAVNILTPFCSAGLNEGVTRYVPLYETRHALRPFLRLALPLVLGVALFLSGAAYVAAETVGRFLFATFHEGNGPAMTAAEELTLARLVAGTTFALIVYFLLLSILKGLRMFRAVSLIELVQNVAFTLLAIVAAVFGWRTAGAMLACYGLTLAGVVLVFATPLQRLLTHADDQLRPLARPNMASSATSVVNQMLRFSSWAALAAIMWQTLQYYPMWYLQKVHGPQATAVFGGVRLIAQAVLLVAVAVVTVVQTSVTKTWELHGAAQADRNLLLAFKATGLVLLLGCVAIAVPANLIIRLLPPGYADGATVMPLVLLSFLVGGHLSFLAIHFNLIEKTRYLFWPWASGVVFNVAAGLWLVRPELHPTAALGAAAWSAVAGTSAALVVSIALVCVERRPLDLGAGLLIASSYTLALPVHFLGAVAAVMLITAWGTDLIFDASEKQRLGQYALAGRRKIGQVVARCFRLSSHCP